MAMAQSPLDRNSERAAGWAANVRERNSTITETDFLRSFPFADPHVRQRIAKALAAFGI